MTRHLKAAVRAACIAAALTAGLAPATSQAQSMPSISDKLAQLQASINAFATSTAARFDAAIAKLDAILARVAEPTTPRVLTTSAALQPPDHFASCTVLNVGASTATVAMYVMDIKGFTLDHKTTTLAPGVGDILSRGLDTPRDIWCRIEPTTAGAQLRAALSIFRTGDLITAVHAEAR